MKKSFIAVDLGASGTKVVAGDFDGERLVLKKLNQFESFSYEKGDLSWWDFEKIFASITKTLNEGKEGRDIETVGFDSWGVDFGLLNNKEELIADPLRYRSMFTAQEYIQEDINKNRDWISHRIPTQFQPFNTVYQLLLYKKLFPEILKEASTILSIPSLLVHSFLGKKLYEFTQATTSQLYNYSKKSWDKELIKGLDLPDIFPEVVPSGTLVKGKNFDIVLPATHDTGSAFASVATGTNDEMIISMGTWCLNGIVVPEISNPEKLLKKNYAVEGCADGKLRVIANTTGLWLVQSLKSLWSKEQSKMTYEKLTHMASNAKAFSGIIDVDNKNFQNSREMDKTVIEESQKFSGKALRSREEIVRTALEGVVFKIRKTKEDLEDLFGFKMKKIKIVGGGTKNTFLCQMISDATGLPVIAGPVEGTALGNILLQLKATGNIKDLEEGRELVRKSFEIKEYQPKNTTDWNEAYQIFLKNMETSIVDNK